MALSKREFKFFLVPKQWKVTNIRTKFFKNSSFRLRASLKQKPCWEKPPRHSAFLFPEVQPTPFALSMFGPMMGFGNCLVLTQGCLLQVSPGEGIGGCLGVQHCWVVPGSTKTSTPRSSDLRNSRPWTLTQRGHLVAGAPVTHPPSSGFLEEYSNHQIRNNYYRSTFFLLYWGRRQLLS